MFASSLRNGINQNKFTLFFITSYVFGVEDSISDALNELQGHFHGQIHSNDEKMIIFPIKMTFS